MESALGDEPDATYSVPDALTGEAMREIPAGVKAAIEPMAGSGEAEQAKATLGNQIKEINALAKLDRLSMLQRMAVRTQEAAQNGNIKAFWGGESVAKRRGGAIVYLGLSLRIYNA